MGMLSSRVQYAKRFIGKRPQAWRLVAADAFAGKARVGVGLNKTFGKTSETLSAARAAADWLLNAQQATSTQTSAPCGYSAGYCIKTGQWRPAYRETTGYIIPTMLQCAEVFNQPAYKESAVEAARWLAGVQRTDGSFAGGTGPDVGQASLVFDTGQALEGLSAAAKLTGEAQLEIAAQKAAHWLCTARNPMGPWVKGSYNGLPHTYHARVASALAKYGAAFNDAPAQQHAEGFCNWVLACQSPNGFFEHMGFSPMEPVWTHTIAYTMEGLITTGEITGRDDYIDVTLHTAQQLLNMYSKHGNYLPGALNRKWAITERACCMPGLAQTALIWNWLARLRHKPEFKASAATARNQLMHWQLGAKPEAALKGSVSGSYPIYKGYQAMACPSWAAKFFIDALLDAEADKPAADVTSP